MAGSSSAREPAGWESARDIARSGRQLVHVAHTVRVDCPFERLSAVLVGQRKDWFPRTIGVHLAGIPVRKRVAVEFGEAVKTSTWAAIRVNWRATFPRQLFPTMQGKVALSPTGNHSTKLTVSGAYTPPLGRLGEDLNEVLMHGIAERTVRELADSVGRRLDRAVADQ
jgi:hypothetical protein